MTLTSGTPLHFEEGRPNAHRGSSVEYNCVQYVGLLAVEWIVEAIFLAIYHVQPPNIG